MPVSRQKLIVLVLVVLIAVSLIALTYYLVIFRGQTEKKSDIERTFFDTTLTLENGEPFDTSRLEGKPVIVVSWATWCPSCAPALTMLSMSKETHGDTIEIVAINRMEEARIVDDYRNAVGLPKNIMFVNDSTDSYFKNVDGRSMPEVLVYNREGVIIEHLLSAPTETELASLLSRLLAN